VLKSREKQQILLAQRTAKHLQAAAQKSSILLSEYYAEPEPESPKELPKDLPKDALKDPRAELFKDRPQTADPPHPLNKKLGAAKTVEVTAQMQQNKTKLLERGERLDAIADRAEDLEKNAGSFLDMAKQLKKQQKKSSECAIN
jgi:hypothetical protein